MPAADIDVVLSVRELASARAPSQFLAAGPLAQRTAVTHGGPGTGRSRPRKGIPCGTADPVLVTLSVRSNSAPSGVRLTGQVRTGWQRPGPTRARVILHRTMVRNVPGAPMPSQEISSPSVRISPREGEAISAGRTGEQGLQRDDSVYETVIWSHTFESSPKQSPSGGVKLAVASHPRHLQAVQGDRASDDWPG